RKTNRTVCLSGVRRKAIADAKPAWRIDAKAYISGRKIMPARVWLIIGILGLNISLLSGQDSLWEQHLAKARKLRADAHYKEAETEYLAAVEAAQAFGAGHPKMARSLNNLAALYQDQGRYAEAETLYQRATAIWERNPGSEEDLAAGFNN